MTLSCSCSRISLSVGILANDNDVERRDGGDLTLVSSTFRLQVSRGFTQRAQAEPEVSVAAPKDHLHFSSSLGAGKHSYPSSFVHRSSTPHWRATTRHQPATQQTANWRTAGVSVTTIGSSRRCSSLASPFRRALCSRRTPSGRPVVDWLPPRQHLSRAAPPQRSLTSPP